MDDDRGRKAMKIKVNGQSESVESNLNLAKLIADKKLSPEKIVVEYNLRVVPASEWSGIIINDNDSIEILSFLGGG